MTIPIGTLVTPVRAFQVINRKEPIKFPQYGIVIGYDEKLTVVYNMVYLQEDMIYMNLADYEIKEIKE